VASAGTVTLAGTVTAALSLDRFTLIADGADPTSHTFPWELMPALTSAGSSETDTSGDEVTVKVVVTVSVPVVTVSVWAPAGAFAAMVRVALS
jgi:hypothetical protein